MEVLHAWNEYSSLFQLIAFIATAFGSGFALARYWRSPSRAQIENVRKKLEASEGRNKELGDIIDQYAATEKALINADTELWSVRPPNRPAGYQERFLECRPKIITIGNLKGGVGKTTMAACLAGYFAKKR